MEIVSARTFSFSVISLSRREIFSFFSWYSPSNSSIILSVSSSNSQRFFKILSVHSILFSRRTISFFRSCFLKSKTERWLLCVPSFFHSIPYRCIISESFSFSLSIQSFEEVSNLPLAIKPCCSKAFVSAFRVDKPRFWFVANGTKSICKCGVCSSIWSTELKTLICGFRFWKSFSNSIKICAASLPSSELQWVSSLLPTWIISS